MRSEAKMMELILSTAREDDRILAVYLEGSRTNPNTPRDIFQDYDVLYVVNETKSFQNDPKWIDRFGPRLYLQYPEDAELYGSDVDNCYGWLIQFADGNRLDLHVATLAHAQKHDLTDSLTRLLLDKTGAMPPRGPGDDSAHWVQKPSQARFSAVCNEFWWCLNNLCKGLWRGEIPYAQWVLNDLLRPQLLTVLSWKAAAGADFRISVGKCGKYLHRFVPQADWQGFLATYCGGDAEAMWRGGEAMCALFDRVAGEAAAALGYAYDRDEARASWGFFRHVRELPRDAKEIF